MTLARTTLHESGRKLKELTYQQINTIGKQHSRGRSINSIAKRMNLSNNLTKKLIEEITKKGISQTYADRKR
jgi:predicted transcriptional regulator